MAKVTPKIARGNIERAEVSKKIDFARLARLVHSQNERIIKRNLEVMGNQLVQIMVGNNADSDAFAGKTLRINLRIGVLTVAKNQVSFEPVSVRQLKIDSVEQNDDMMSKVSSMSRMTVFKNHGKSHSQMVTRRKQSFGDSVSLSKMPLMNSNLAKPPVIEHQDGLMVTINPITGHTQHFKQSRPNEVTIIDSGLA